MKYLIYTISEQTCNLHGYELVLMRKHINLTCQLITGHEHVYVKTTDILNFNRQIADKTLPRISKYCLHFSQQVDLVRFVLTMNSKKTKLSFTPQQQRKTDVGQTDNKW